DDTRFPSAFRAPHDTARGRVTPQAAGQVVAVQLARVAEGLEVAARVADHEPEALRDLEGRGQTLAGRGGGIDINANVLGRQNPRGPGPGPGRPASAGASPRGRSRRTPPAASAVPAPAAGHSRSPGPRSARQATRQREDCRRAQSATCQYTLAFPPRARE